MNLDLASIIISSFYILLTIIVYFVRVLDFINKNIILVILPNVLIIFSIISYKLNFLNYSTLFHPSLFSLLEITIFILVIQKLFGEIIFNTKIFLFFILLILMILYFVFFDSNYSMRSFLSCILYFLGNFTFAFRINKTDLNPKIRLFSSAIFIFIGCLFLLRIIYTLISFPEVPTSFAEVHPINSIHDFAYFIQTISFIPIVLTILQIQSIETITKTKKKLAKINGERKLVLSILSHDFKTQFQSLLGFSSLLVHKNKKQTLTSEEINNYSSTIYLTTKDILSQLESLLDLNRVSHKNEKIAFSKIDFMTCKQNLDKRIKYLIENKEIELSFNYPENGAIYGNPHLINSVLFNLISNAIKFSPHNSKISINSEIEEDFFYIVIADEGIGIPSEKIPNLFQNSILNSTLGTGKEPGTGFGLFLTKQIVDKHGGQIWIESTEGIGTKIHLKLPKWKESFKQ